MKSLREQQSEFTRAFGVLTAFIDYMGYEWTFGDTYPHQKHRVGSFHEKGLAVDINLFKDGRYLTLTEDHRLFGEYWKTLGGTWGGDFQRKDGNHYSWNER